MALLVLETNLWTPAYIFLKIFWSFFQRFRLIVKVFVVASFPFIISMIWPIIACLLNDPSLDTLFVVISKLIESNAPVPNSTVPNPLERSLTVQVFQWDWDHYSYIGTIHCKQFEYTYANVVPSNPNVKFKYFRGKNCKSFGKSLGNYYWCSSGSGNQGNFKLHTAHCGAWAMTLMVSWLADSYNEF